MPQSLDNQVYSISLAATVNNPLDFQNAAASLPPFSQSYGWSSGVAAGQADRIFADQRTIAISGTDPLDLAGVLVDAVGTLLTFARIKAMAIRASANNTNNVIVGGAGANGFISWVGAAAHTVTVRPGGMLLLVAPDAVAYTVTPATADILQIANSGAGTTVTYDVVLIGASA